jgi:FMN-dependent dehydrogenase/Domain of unknown function (DUF4158)
MAFVKDPTPEELKRFFFLDESALERRGRSADATTVSAGRSSGGTVRMLGTFLEDPSDVPQVVVDYAAEQLEVDDPSCIKQYAAPGERAEIHIDTGVLSGADLVAAVGLGATGVMVGRAYLYGLTAGGERGSTTYWRSSQPRPGEPCICWA